MPTLVHVPVTTLHNMWTAFNQYGILIVSANLLKAHNSSTGLKCSQKTTVKERWQIFTNTDTVSAVKNKSWDSYYVCTYV